LFVATLLAAVKPLCQNGAMTRGYGQYCGLARALDLVGGRWSLLIVRELLTGPKRFGELEKRLPGVATNVLSSRLRELEEAGLVQRSLLAPASSSVVYGLTPYGLELEGPVVHLALWGSKSLGRPTEDDFFSLSALAIALRGAFRPEKARSDDIVVEIRFGEQPLYVDVRSGQVSFPSEPTSTSHLILECSPRVFAELLAGRLDIDSAVASDRVRIDGSKREARRFFETFRLPSREEAAR
jgi:DNA-binding HxlR family transcriptional regulator/putative sterol carrier protein